MELDCIDAPLGLALRLTLLLLLLQDNWQVALQESLHANGQ